MKQRIVIVGGGFGGLLVARGLKYENVEITLIDRSNHHLFQPLLYQVATAGLASTDIASPIRSILSKQSNIEVIMGEVTDVDARGKKVFACGKVFPYDTLVLATGARYNYFGKPEWESIAPGLKTISDAMKIRKKILTSFEAAEIEDSPEKRKAFLTFILVGGGPTGVELAGSIAELAHHALKNDFRKIDPKSARVLLLEAGPRVLAGFSEIASKEASSALKRLGVEVRTKSRVELIDPQGVKVNGERIKADTVVWAAGVIASAAGKWLKTKMDHVGRVVVASDLRVAEHSEVYVIGDTAAVVQNGKPLPGLAPVAMQQGRYVARSIRARLRGQNVPDFYYRDKGNLATVGRGFAVADVGALRLHGLIAWIAWVVVHIYYLIGFRNRFFVLTEWAWAYLTFRRGARLIPEGLEASEISSTSSNLQKFS